MNEKKLIKVLIIVSILPLTYIVAITIEEYPIQKIIKEEQWIDCMPGPIDFKKSKLKSRQYPNIAY